MASNPKDVKLGTDHGWEPRVVGSSGDSGYYREMGRTNGGGGSGDDPMIDIANLKNDVDLLKKAVGFMFATGLAAIAGSYLLLASDIRQNGRDVAAQGATLEGVEKSLDRIEGKIDANQPQASDKPE